MALLIIEKGKEKGKQISLADGDKVIIGRDKFCQFMIDDMLASRKHVQIECRNGHFLIRDLGSSNGTLVNGEKITAQSLEVNDQIQIGDTLLSFVEDLQEISQTAEFKEGLIAGYQLSKRVGRGGMGTVYLAEQVSLQRQIALKILSQKYALDQNFVALFIEEARAAGQLNHQNIVQVYDVGQVGSTYYFSMEYMSHGSVEELVNEEGALPLDRAIHIVLQAAKGLEYAEKKRIIHRDIKPANLMLGEEDLVKICDLGIAKRLQEHQISTETEGISGSPHYIAPEHALGQPIDHRVDIYSLGVTFYQLLCGRTPYRGRSAREIILKHVEEDPFPLKEANPNLPDAIHVLVAKMMEKDPVDRFSSASQVVDALEKWPKKASDHSSKPVLPDLDSQRGDGEKKATTTQLAAILTKQMAPFVKRNRGLLFSILLLFVLALIVFVLKAQLDRVRTKKLSDQYTQSQKAFTAGRYYEARRSCREILTEDPQGEWGARARALMAQIRKRVQEQEQKELALVDQKAQKIFDRLKGDSDKIQTRVQAKVLLDRVVVFQARYSRSSLLEKASELERKILAQITNFKESEARLKEFSFQARRAYEKVTQQAQEQAELERYGWALDSLEKFPSRYGTSTYGRVIENLKKKYRREGRAKFWKFIKNSSLYKKYEVIWNLYRQKKFSILPERINQCYGELRRAEGIVLQKAAHIGLADATKEGKAFLKRIEKNLNLIKRRVEEIVTQEERSLFDKTLVKTKKYIRDFDLSEALSKLGFAQKFLTSPRYLKELGSYAGGVRALQNIKTSLIAHINREKKYSQIHRYLRKYGTVVSSVAIRADESKIVFFSHRKQKNHHIFWRSIPPGELISFFVMMGKKTGLTPRDYFAMGFYAYHARLREKAIVYLAEARRTNLRNRGTSSYSKQLAEEITFFTRKL